MHVQARGMVAAVVCAILAAGCGQSDGKVRARREALADGVAPGWQFPQGYWRDYDANANLAWSGNGYALPAVAFDCIPGYEPIHLASNVNDGKYGNGSSWVSSSANSWVKIDLGRTVQFDTFRSGRDRTGNFSDRSWGRFWIYAAVADADDQYALVYDSATDPQYPGWLTARQTIVARFAPVWARFVKLVVQEAGAAVDEIEIESSASAPLGTVAVDREGYHAGDSVVVTVRDANVGATEVHVYVNDTKLKLTTVAPGVFEGSLTATAGTLQAVYTDEDDGTGAKRVVASKVALVSDALPDLAVTALTVAPDAAWAGDTVTFSYAVANAPGGQPSPASSVAIYLSTDPAFDPRYDPEPYVDFRPDTLPNVYRVDADVPALAPGDSFSGTATVALPFPFPGGTYYLFALVDPANAIQELNEGTNALLGAGTIAITGDIVRPGFAYPQSLARPYRTVANLAFGKPVTAFDCIPGFAPIHLPENVNDGYYGNGSSWISASNGSWITIDLGEPVVFDTFRGGRDRTAAFDDRSWGRFWLYASDDDASYALVYDSITDTAYTGELGLGQTVVAQFTPVTARYVRLVVEREGAAVDEIELTHETP